jgi:hypothetical protein
MSSRLQRCEGLLLTRLVHPAQYLLLPSSKEYILEQPGSLFLNILSDWMQWKPVCRGSMLMAEQVMIKTRMRRKWMLGSQSHGSGGPAQLLQKRRRHTRHPHPSRLLVVHAVHCRQYPRFHLLRARSSRKTLSLCPSRLRMSRVRVIICDGQVKLAEIWNGCKDPIRLLNGLLL